MDAICQELLLEHPVEFVDELSIFIGDLVSNTYIDDLPEAHSQCISQYELCSAKVEITRCLAESNGLNSIFGSSDGQEGVYSHLVPPNLRSLEEQLVGFQKELATLDLESILRVQKWAIYERRQAVVMVEIIEKRIRALQPAGYAVWASMKPDFIQAGT